MIQLILFTISCNHVTALWRESYTANCERDAQGSWTKMTAAGGMTDVKDRTVTYF